MFYSKSTGGFYIAEVHGIDIPADAVAITKDEHFALMSGQSVGKVISSDKDGNPVIADSPVIAPTIRQELAQLDAENALTQRNLRETVMLMAESVKTLSNGTIDLTQIPGVAKVFEVEAMAAELRAKL